MKTFPKTFAIILIITFKSTVFAQGDAVVPNVNI